MPAEDELNAKQKPEWAIDPEAIRRRQQAREAARLVVELAEEVVSGAEADCREIVRGEILAALAAQHPPATAPAITPMRDEESRRFGRRLIPFGRYKGHRIDSAPLDYLLWLIDQNRQFIDDLRRYCLSPRIQAEQTDE